MAYCLAQEKAAELNDPEFAKQKKMFDKLGVLDAWKITRGSGKTAIGIVDTGFDFYHPEFKGRISPGFYASGAYHPEIYENIAHGTLVSSIIAASPDNGIGMAGLAPDCPVITASIGTLEHALMKLQKDFVRKNPGAGMADLQKEMARRQDELKKFSENWLRHIAFSTADSIKYLVDRGVKVINLSLYLDKSLMTEKENRKKLDDAFEYAKKKDVILMLGAGNNAIESDDYPGDETFTIVIGASMLDDTRWEVEHDMMGQKIKQGSNFGKRLTVMAPVENIVVCSPHDERCYSSKDSPFGATKMTFQGICQVLPSGATSSATPVASSLVALVRSLRPDLKAPEVIEIIKNGCDDIGDEGYDKYTGYGRINFARTLQLAKDWGK